MKVVDAKTMRRIDASAVRKLRMRPVQLMECAGLGVAAVVMRELESRWRWGGRHRVSVFAGKGNNGGDGYVVARHLLNRGVDARVYSTVKPDLLKGDALLNARVWLEMGGELKVLSTKREVEKIAPDIRHSSIIVDALLGTGLSTPVSGAYAEAVALINSLERTVVAVDVPSGIDATTGAVLGCAVRATVTATMALPKTGFYSPSGAAHAGRVEVVDIGIPSVLLEDPGIRWNLTEDSDVAGILRPRRCDSHKGSYGHLLVLAGSPGKTGAACMAASGAMRTGAGLTTLGVPASVHQVVEEKTTEVMTAPVPETPERTFGAVSFDRVSSLMEGKSALLTGPGIGNTADSARFMEKLVRGASAPLVIDADGLNCLAGGDSVLKEATVDVVLTPHPGEAARLLDTTVDRVQADREGSAVELAERTGAVVVLKGSFTVVAGPGGEVWFNPTGGPALATAGTGDVLSGMIGALLAQGHTPLDASVAAVYVHGAAADLFSGEKGETGMMATDLLPLIPEVINRIAGRRGDGG